jgi:capsular polysaccharide transport system permease protein
MDGSFWDALRNQGRVIAALYISEGLNRFARRSWGLFEEMMSILIHVIGFSAIRLLTGATSHRGMPMIPFLVSGVFTYWIFKTTLVPVSNFQAAKSRYPVFPRVTQLDILIARFLVNVSLYMFVSLLTFYVLYLVNLSAPIHNFVELVGLLLLAGFWGLSIGLILGGVYTVLPILRTLTSGFLRILMYTSGVFYVWPEVPYSLRPIAIWNPFFHIEEFMHSAYFEVYHSPIASWKYVTTFTVIVFFLGLVTERRFRPMNVRSRPVEETDPYELVDAL